MLRLRQLRVPFLVNPHNEDYSFGGSILGSRYLGKLLYTGSLRQGDSLNPKHLGLAILVTPSLILESGGYLRLIFEILQTALSILYLGKDGILVDKGHALNPKP